MGSPTKTRKGLVRRGRKDQASQPWDGARDPGWPGKGKVSFSLNKGRAELLNQLAVFAFVLPYPGLAKALGGDGTAHFLRIVSPTLHFERANCWSPLLSSLQEESFVQQLNQAVWDAKPFHFRSGFGPPKEEILPLFHICEVVSSLRDWTGVFHPTEIRVLPSSTEMSKYQEVRLLLVKHRMKTIIETSCFYLQWMNLSQDCLWFPYRMAKASVFLCLGLTDSKSVQWPHQPHGYVH